MDSAAAAAAPPVPAVPSKKDQWPRTSDGKPAEVHKIEYHPLVRTLDTVGGVDLTLLDKALEPVLTGRGIRARSTHELGTVDITDLILSLRSRLEVEVGYALSLLQILSLGDRTPGGLQLAPCEDLLEELLSLLEDLVYGSFPTKKVADKADPLAPPSPPLEKENGANGADPVPALSETVASSPVKYKSHLSLVREAKADELSIRPFRRVGKDGSLWTLSMAERRAEQDAMSALTVLNILRNCVQLPANVAYCNAQTRLWPLLVHLAEVVDFFSPPGFVGGRTEHEDEDAGDELGVLPFRLRGGLEGKPFRSLPPGASVPFTYDEAVRVRKDVLVIVTALAGEHTDLAQLPSATVQGLWALLTSFLFDFEAGQEVDGRLGLSPTGFRIPYYADVALEGLARLTQPDRNRAMVRASVGETALLAFGQNLIRRLPVEMLDFQVMLQTEFKIAYLERVALSWFNLVSLAPAGVRATLATPGTKNVLLTAVETLSTHGNDFARNPFSVLAARLCASLRILLLGPETDEDDAGLPFPGPAAHDHDKSAPLADKTFTVIKVLAVPGLDPHMAADLQALI